MVPDTRTVLDFALRQGRIVSVESVALGAECGCICPKCSEPLIAKNRDFVDRKIKKHFSHTSKTTCPGARESALHLLAKQVVFDGKRIAVPTVPLFDEGHQLWQQYRAPEVIEFESTTLEPSIGGLRPDVIGRRGDEIVMLEIYVTHAVDEKKRYTAAQNQWTMLEITISALLESNFTEHDVRTFLVDSFTDRRWINHAGADALRRRLSRASDFWLSDNGCPLGLGKVPRIRFNESFTAYDWRINNASSPCSRCEFLLRTSPDGVECTGRSQVNSLATLGLHESGDTIPEPTWVSAFRMQRDLEAADSVLSYQWQCHDVVARRLNGAPVRWIQKQRKKLRQLYSQMQIVTKQALSNDLRFNDAHWKTPFMEFSGNSADGPIQPRLFEGKRLRPLDFKRPVSFEHSQKLDENGAAELGLYWDIDAAVWCFVTSGGENETVPLHLRPYLDRLSDWKPVYPEDRNRLRGAQSSKRKHHSSSDDYERVSWPNETTGTNDVEPARSKPIAVHEILASNAGQCGTCGASLNRVRFLAGMLAGREALCCSSMPRHPLKMLPRN